jgi:hypothetical protein
MYWRKIGCLEREREGANLREKGERIISQNLERESERENEYFGFKLAYIPLACEYPNCPWSQSCLPDTDTQVHI